MDRLDIETKLNTESQRTESPPSDPGSGAAALGVETAGARLTARAGHTVGLSPGLRTRASRSPLAFGFTVAAAALATACGSASSDLPPELLAAIEARSQAVQEPGGYPTTNLGRQEGDTAQDLCFPGWMDPAATTFDFAQTNEICFSDFFDPDGQEHTLLLVNTAALWCGACRTEYGGQGDRPPLREEVEQRRERGLRILGTVFQDVNHEPADESDIELWAQVYEVDFPLALDADFRMGAFASSDSAPYNALIDTRTMQIVLVLQGDHPGALWPTVDQYLEDNPPRVAN